MFSRIRYAAQVLTSSPVDPRDRADIVFEEQAPVEVTRASRLIGGLIEILVVSVAIGLIGTPLVVRFWPKHQVSNVSGLTAVVASVLTFLGIQLFERFKAQIGQHLRIGEHVGPYFGRRITGAIRILRS